MQGMDSGIVNDRSLFPQHFNILFKSSSLTENDDIIKLRKLFSEVDLHERTFAHTELKIWNNFSLYNFVKITARSFAISYQRLAEAI